MLYKYAQINYIFLIIFFVLSLLLALILFIASYLMAKQSGGVEKLSAYECGFEPFDDARTHFDVKFYLIALLFLLFDIEVIFLFPWSVSLGCLGFFWLLAYDRIPYRINFRLHLCVEDWCIGSHVVNFKLKN
jgi:NADH-quinone oxidoreductase subunit A